MFRNNMVVFAFFLNWIQAMNDQQLSQSDAKSIKNIMDFNKAIINLAAADNKQINAACWLKLAMNAGKLQLIAGNLTADTMTTEQINEQIDTIETQFTKRMKRLLEIENGETKNNF